jgi:hypothetical protein
VINAGFSPDALNAVQNLLPEEGQCNQKRKRDKSKLRTPAQREADQSRSIQQPQRPQTAASDARSEAAKRAAQIKKKCKNSSQQQVPADQFKPL